MEEVTLNCSVVSCGTHSCANTLTNKLRLGFTDLLTFTIGQPMVFRLLWLSFTSKRPTDILNCNLAMFNNVHYLQSLLHLIVMIILPCLHSHLLTVLLVYVQTGGPSSLCFISLERYVAVIHPTSYPLIKKYRWREVCAVFVWLSTILSTVIVGLNSDKTYLNDDLLKTIPMAVMSTMTLIMLWCSVKIALALRQSGPGRDKLHPLKKRALITVSATTTITLIFYIPVAAMQINSSTNEFTQKCIITPICVMLLSAASVVHPLFYLHTQASLFSCRGRSDRPG